MKTFKLLLIIAFIGTTISLSAQNRGDRQFVPEDVAKRQTEALKKEISLTNEQEPKVKAIYLKYAKKQDESMKAGQGTDWQSMSDEDRTKRREEWQKTTEERDKEIKKVITAEQYKKYEKWRDEQNSRRRGRN